MNLNTRLGRILKDEQTLESYKIEDGVTIHLVKSKSTNADGGASTGQPSATSEPASTGSSTNA